MVVNKYYYIDSWCCCCDGWQRKTRYIRGDKIKNIKVQDRVIKAFKKDVGIKNEKLIFQKWLAYTLKSNKILIIIHKDGTFSISPIAHARDSTYTEIINLKSQKGGDDESYIPSSEDTLSLNKNVSIAKVEIDKKGDAILKLDELLSLTSQIGNVQLFIAFEGYTKTQNIKEMIKADGKYKPKGIKPNELNKIIAPNFVINLAKAMAKAITEEKNILLKFGIVILIILGVAGLII